MDMPTNCTIDIQEGQQNMWLLVMHLGINIEICSSTATKTAHPLESLESRSENDSDASDVEGEMNECVTSTGSSADVVWGPDPSHREEGPSSRCEGWICCDNIWYIT